MAEVTYAFGTTPPDERQAVMLAILEEAVEAVRADQVSGVAVAFVDKAHGVTSNYSCSAWLELLGGVARLQYQMQCDIDAAAATE